MYDIPSPPSSPEINPSACPSCKEILGEGVISDLNRQGFSRPSRMCAAHKYRSAMVEFQQLFPNADVNVLEMRLDKHQEQIRALIAQSETLHFRGALQKEFGDKPVGRKKMVQMDWHNVPGYHGEEGTYTIMSYIRRLFDDELQKVNGIDDFVRSIGIVRFVQLVIVPEVATQLIMEDLNCSAEEARKAQAKCETLLSVIDVNEELMNRKRG